MDSILTSALNSPIYGAMHAGTGMDHLLFSLLAEAVADIRRIREAHQDGIIPEIQKQKFAAWERGRIVSSAGFILGFSERLEPAERRGGNFPSPS